MLKKVYYFLFWLENDWFETDPEFITYKGKGEIKGISFAVKYNFDKKCPKKNIKRKLKELIREKANKYFKNILKISKKTIKNFKKNNSIPQLADEWLQDATKLNRIKYLQKLVKELRIKKWEDLIDILNAPEADIQKEIAMELGMYSKIFD